MYVYVSTQNILSLDRNNIVRSSVKENDISAPELFPAV